MKEKKVLAVDLGASSGRVMIGRFDGKTIQIEELHRFSNDPVFLNGTMYWDFLRLFYEIKQGLLASKKYGEIHSVSVDAWGVDFGLLDESGNLLENPVHYRDGRTSGMLKAACSKIDQNLFYGITGNQFMEINTAFQLLSLDTQRKKLLDQADALLLMPDLFHYFLSGEKCSECSIASTTQLMDAHKKEWAKPVFEALGLPERLMQHIVPCATVVGTLQPAICTELDIAPMAVVASAGHDTQCALAAVPATEKDFIFISCGTWSLFGTELDAPLINEKSANYNITNECGAGGKTSFLKNIIGLWLVQESRRQWRREGQDYSFDELEQTAGQTEPFQSFINPDAPEFVPAGDLPERIRTYCRKTGQTVPDSPGAIVRCINESLAFTYRTAFEEIKACTGRDYQVIHMIGGGTQSAMLCQMTANACGRRVVAGPVEATVYGNAALQLIASGDIKTLDQARKVIAASVHTVVYEPEDIQAWTQAYEQYQLKTSLSGRRTGE